MLGLSKRFSVDVTVLRIAAVVLAFVSFGTAVLLYLIGLLIVPREPGGKPSNSKLGWILAIVLLICIVVPGWSLVRGWMTGLAVTALIVVIVVLSSRNKPVQHAEPTPFERARDSWSQRLEQVKATAAAGNSEAPLETPGDELAEVPTIQGPVIRRWRGWLFALSLIVLGVGVLLALQLVFGIAIRPVFWAAMVLFAFGLTLTISTWRGRPRFMVMTAVLAIFVVAFMAIPTEHIRALNLFQSEDRIVFTDASDIADQDMSFDGTVYDFTDLKLEEDAEMRIEQSFGSAKILLPESVVVDGVYEASFSSVTITNVSAESTDGCGFSCSGEFGNAVAVALPSAPQMTPGASDFDELELPPVEVTSGPTLHLSVDVSFGSLEVVGS